MAGPAESWEGRDVIIPADAWDPPLEKAATGYVIKVLEPTKRIPNRRIEVKCKGHRDRYVFSEDSFPKGWLLDTRGQYGPPPKTPTKRGAARSAAPNPAVAAAAPADSSSDTPATAAAQAANAQTAGTGDAPPAGAARSPSRSPSRSRSRSPARRGRGRSPRQPRTPTGGKSVLRDPASNPSGRRVTFQDQQGIPKVTVVPRISKAQNALNFAIMVGVALPALALGYAVCDPAAFPATPDAPIDWAATAWDDPLSLSWWLRLGRHQPLEFVNLVFLLNVDVLFWLIALVQGTTWLIDPYWTFIPVLIQLFYRYHPGATEDATRGGVAAALIYIWSTRLTHSYFRREEWQFGAREDWRFTDLNKQVGWHWWWLSFFATYITQHAMLVGISLPLYAVYTTTAPFGVVDAIAAAACATGLTLGYVADTQLAAFMAANRARRDAGQQPILILDTGLWHYSRHPNYFSECLFWTGLAGFAVGLGKPWFIGGTVFNTLCMFQVTVMTETRMAARPERLAQWLEYKRTTSAWIPWFKGKPHVA